MNTTVKQPNRKNNTTVWDVKEEMNAHHATIRNLGTEHKVEVFWGLNEAMTQDNVIKIKIGDKEAYVEVEELLRFTRWSKV